MKLKINYKNIIGLGIIGDYNYIGTILSGLIQDVKPKEKILFSFFKDVFINKDLRTAHWVGHSLLKELYYNNVFDRKQMIEDLESELTGTPKETSNTDNVDLAEQENVDKATTAEAKAIKDMENDIKEEQSTKYYKQTMNVDIENINTI